MALVSEHTNVYRSCIALLDLKGWEIKAVSPPYDDEVGYQDTYEATKDGTVIKADNPVSLLGLASIHEYHHPHGDEPYWWVIKNERNLYNQLRHEAMERSFLEYWRQKPKTAKKRVLKAIEASEKDPGTPAHERLWISSELLQKLIDAGLE